MAEALSEMPLPSAEQEDVGSRVEIPRRRPLARRLLFPLKEAYFVGIGAADWMFEQAMTIERNLSARGHRRNEMLGKMASKMGATVSDKTRAMSDRGRARVQKMGKQASEGMQEMGASEAMPVTQPA